jgi:putative solute:sodium symporter small subunit
MRSPSKKIPPYWQQTRRLTIILLASWFILTFGILFFARELTSIHFFGWSFSFYMAAQGLTLVYVLILGIFSLYSHRIERLNQKTGTESN